MRALALVALVVIPAGCLGATDGAARPPRTTEPAAFDLEEVATGLVRPTFLAFGDDSGRLFVTEQPGRVRVIDGGRVLPTPYLDLTDKVGSEGEEQGLFSLAFHPRFASNGLLYVSYTDRRGDSVLERYERLSQDPPLADPASGTPILTVEQPYANHNGGLVVFGPDGDLWFGLGDGGSANDPHGNGQDKGTLLGKLLRIDVDAASPYAIPADNPFRSTSGAKPEIWAYGLRNPWRFSFDRATKDLYIGDVGQNEWEEIDFEPAGSPGGVNYGWNVYEGSHPFRPGSAPGYVAPVAEYRNAGSNCSVTAGYVYRGTALPSLAGSFLFADYCSGALWRLAREDGTWVVHTLEPLGFRVSSFGEDAAGELYALDHGGRVLRFVARP